ncbi:MAG: cell division protein ZapA [bacterium]|nr:cell division protein ZapA [bacterium]
MVTQVNVKIFGQEFTIKGEDSPAYVESLAQFVDKKMREVASASSVITSHKVAMLTAINIADELFRLRKELKDKNQQVESKAADLMGLLDSALSR